MKEKSQPRTLLRLRFAQKFSNPKKVRGQPRNKTALIHDYLLCFGGAERVLKTFHEMFPEAPIYVISYDKKIVKKHFPDAKIYASWIQRIPFFRKHPKYLLPFLPMAVESFDLSDYDLVLSSSSAFAKGVVTKPKTTHVCYCHTPMRFVWDYYHDYNKTRRELSGIRGIFSKIFLHYIRIWDKHCEMRVDYFVANSEHTKKRINKFYRRDAEVVYPPVTSLSLRGNEVLNLSDKRMVQDEVTEAISREGRSDDSQNNNGIASSFSASRRITPCNDNRRGYFLIISQLRPYKRIDVAIEAFNKLELPLVIIGDGPEKKKLKKIAKKNISFLGPQDDDFLARCYSECKAFVFPGEEDFGITAVEAMSFGKPVVAYRKGGLTESVIEGKTGEFFDDLEPAVLADGVRRLIENHKNYNPEVIKKRALDFNEEKFKQKIIEFLDNIYQ